MSSQTVTYVASAPFRRGVSELRVTSAQTRGQASAPVGTSKLGQTRHSGVSRRTFVKGLAVGGAAATLGLLRSPAASAGVRARQPQATARQPQGTLSGTEFDLTIGETPVNLTGRERL